MKIFIASKKENTNLARGNATTRSRYAINQ
jgi:hypothetical protein